MQGLIPCYGSGGGGGGAVSTLMTIQFVEHLSCVSLSFVCHPSCIQRDKAIMKKIKHDTQRLYIQMMQQLVTIVWYSSHGHNQYLVTTI